MSDSIKLSELPTSAKILDTIGALQSSLTKTEKRIATAILASPNILSKYSLSEISEYLDVGEATFVRFCRSLGFKGYTDFKIKLSVELATLDKQAQAILDTDVTDQDSAYDIAKKLQVSLNNVISETINLLDYNQLQKVVDLLHKAKRIFLFGVGSSGITAEDVKHKWMRIGLQVEATTNNHFMYMQSSLMKEEDVFIGISHSGQSEEIIRALQIAQRSQAKTIAITHNLKSPITKVADYVLINGNRQGQMQGGSIGTKVAQLFVLDIIYSMLVARDEQSAIEAKQKTIDVILEQRIK